jgi:hypothetical protein
MIIIYGLIDPRDQQLHYVGCTRRTLKQRLEQHLYSLKAARNSRKSAAILALRASGLRPEAVVLQECETPAEADLAEHEWISNLRMVGCDLWNMQPGGNRPPVQRGFRMSKESRAKMSAAKKGKKLSPEHCAKLSAPRRS